MAGKPEQDMNLAEGQGYLIGDRSHIAACRLNLQHYLWKAAIGYNVHPSIPISSAKIVADIAAGTCMWLVDEATNYPAVQFEAFDNNLAQVPNASLIPKNCSIKYWNFLEDLPEEMIGRYDFVHIRLLVLAIEQSQLPLVLRKILKMLKPSGYLQWDELDVKNVCVKKVDPTVPSPALDQLVTISRSNGRYDWTLEMKNVMEEEGFQDTSLELIGDPPELVRPMNDLHLMSMEEIGVGFARRGQLEMASKLYQLIKDSYQEASLGTTLCFPRLVAVGRKSSA